jgi:micrococcal nuclease
MLKTPHYLLLFLFLFLSGIPSTAQKPSNWYQVSKIVDGDTFWIINEKGENEKIRLIGVDAPESRKSGKKEIGYYGKESKLYLEKFLAGKKVRLQFDVGKYDRYKRTLAYVYLEDGTFLNAHLVKYGYAAVMTVPPNVKFADQFVKLQKEAREKKRGLWK